ncbi:MAG: ATP-dependent helicase [Candidatus Poribacteria bacterium]|nr:ATP-dependent helicase [Candidatus Poribacteria bacterium]
MFDTKTLNDSQSLVVIIPAEKHILCVAGPGSGKTRTMTYRLAYLALERNMLPSRLRAVTFSRAATSEMKERLHSLDDSLNEVEITTIHSLCRYIISQTQGATLEQGDFRCYIEGGAAFKKKNPEKAITEAVSKVIEHQSQEDFKDPVRELKLKVSSSSSDIAKKILAISDRGNPKEILEMYIQHQKVKNHCSEHIADAKLPTFSYKYARHVLRLPKNLGISPSAFYRSVYEQYCEILTEWKLLDFTDQIIYAHLGLLFSTQPTLRYLQSLWDILAVDEFQDVDAIQFEVFRLLCAGDMRLNAVGDPDQAIYGFRGGDATFISDFKRWYPDAEILKLDTNYRSNTEIIDVAYSAVESIEQPHRAKGESANGVGGTVGFAGVKKIGDFPTGSVGVLAWTNKTLNKISRELLWSGIVCSINTRWGSRLNVPIESYRVVYQTLESFGMVTGEIVFGRDVFLKNSQDMKNIGDTVMKVEGETLTELRKDSRVAGYARFLQSLKRLDTSKKVQAILNSDDFPSATPEVSEALATLDFSQTYDAFIDDVNINLYTIHRAKGLEFDTVFVQTEDFAKSFANENPDESMRLLFVGLSRAKQNLFLFGGGDQGNAITFPVVRKINEMSTTKSEAASRSSTGIEVPEGMPLTNRLDKMTVEQAIWAIRNGDAWLAYLKAKGGEIYPPVVLEQPIEVSDADK